MSSTKKAPRRLGWPQRLKVNPVISVVLVVTAVVIGLGHFTGALSSIQSFWTTYIAPPTDPRTFRFDNQVVHLSHGNGTSKEEAVVIEGAFTTDAGLAAEKHWIHTFYPDYRIVAQSLIEDQQDEMKMFDALTIESTIGFRRVLYFDITEFFGTPVSDQELERSMEQWILEHATNANSG